MGIEPTHFPITGKIQGRGREAILWDNMEHKTTKLKKPWE
jgi:hypothetical protein